MTKFAECACDRPSPIAEIALTYCDLPHIQSHPNFVMLSEAKNLLSHATFLRLHSVQQNREYFTLASLTTSIAALGNTRTMSIPDSLAITKFTVSFPMKRSST